MPTGESFVATVLTASGPTAILMVMRIIAGKWRGRRFDAPDGDSTRPILDRVKTVLFDILGNRLAEPGRLPPLAVLDLFAGSGSLGLEALSRGAWYCLMVERHPQAARLLRRTLNDLGSIGDARVVEGDATFCPLPPPKALPGEPAVYRLVFVDPPYRLMNGAEPDPGMQQLMRRLATSEVIADDALIIIRHPLLRAPPDLSPLVEEDRRDVGKMTLRFVRLPSYRAPTVEEAP